MNAAVTFILSTACISALFACLLGWLLSMSGNYDTATLQLHQWMGLTVATVTGLCWWLKKKKSHTVYNISLILLFLSMVVAGHGGGTLTHGEGYLSFFEEETVAPVRKPIEDINEALVYSELVQPILHEKCYNCHSAQKTKGGLRVDNEKWLFKGGKTGPSIRPGNPDESELMIRMLLPMDDDKRMPPKKQPQLTDAEIALIHWWIQNNAPTDKKVKDLPTEAIQTALASFAQPAESKAEISPLSAVYDKDVPAADAGVIKDLKQKGILVEPISKGSSLLDVSCVNYAAFSDADMSLLEKIAPNVVSLKLDNTAITDAALEKIARFENLVKLNLANTATGSAMAILQQLQALEYLNMTGTKLDDTNLQLLSTLSALKQVYCWNSLVTEKGIVELKKQKPSLVILAAVE